MDNKELKNKPEIGVENSEPQYDPHIVPAETGARMEREGNAFRTTPDEDTDPESIDTTAGYTVDKEGLIDNYAIEPEMYINEPGDLRQKEEQLKSERANELRNLRQDEKGNLTTEEDKRPRGQGMV